MRFRWPALILLLAVGCNRPPAAPILSDSRIYHSAAEGLRFLVPDGWSQNASSVLPAGPLKGEVLLVRYTLASDEPGSALIVFCSDEKNAADLASHHAQPSLRVEHWEVTEPPKTLKINGVNAERIVYKSVADGPELTKFVTCFRRNGRVYSFVGLFSSNDETARQQVERATGDVIWTAG